MLLRATIVQAPAKPGRPRKHVALVPGAPAMCIWPERGDVCGAPRTSPLAVCAKHAKVLKGPPQARCVWPGCAQSGFRALCVYHEKLACGLLTRGR